MTLVGDPLGFLGGFFASLFRQGGFTPHSFCLAYDDFALYGSILGHQMICCAYFTLGVQVLWCMWRYKHGAVITCSHLGLLMTLSGLFILSCGIGHLLMEQNYTYAYYRLEAIWHIWTGLVSLATTIAWPVNVRTNTAA